jgi:hypothetical protein
MSSGQLVLYSARRPNEMTRRPDGWQGTKISDLRTVQSPQETLLNSGIPVKKHHYIEVISYNKMQPTQKLTKVYQALIPNEK